MSSPGRHLVSREAIATTKENIYVFTVQTGRVQTQCAQYKGDVCRLSVSYLHLSVTPDSTSHLKQSLWVLDNPTGWVVGVDPGGQGDHVHGARVLQLRRLRPGQRGPGPEVRRQERLVFYRHLSTAELLTIVTSA